MATYSGMVPGVLSGQYDQSLMEIDLVRLAAAAGARLIIEEVVGHDPQTRRLLFRERAPLEYDVLSIGVGSVPNMGSVEFDGGSVLAIKPMQTFLKRFDQRFGIVMDKIADRPIHVTIVGAGIGGVEIAFCTGTRLRQHLGSRPFVVNLVTSADQVAAGTSTSTQRAVETCLAERDIQLHKGFRVQSVTHQHVCERDGRRVRADIVLWATGATAPDWLREMGLATDDRGFLLTRPTLRSVSSDRVFAVGDTGTIEDNALPKAGVHAVRQGPVLWTNIHRLLNQQPLAIYRPQRSFLKLINLGDGTAIGDYGGRTVRGGWAWSLKDYIDRRFMKMYHNYEPTKMSMPAPDDSATEMRCTGCGGKVGSATLSASLAELSFANGPEVIRGLDEPDDAAILSPPHGESLVVSNDFFAPPLDDLYMAGRIAALNATSDIHAMGARPWSALAQVTIPEGSARAQSRVLRDLLGGAKHEFDSMSVSVVGGHTLEGPQMTIGFTVLGSAAQSDLDATNQLSVGDQLLLTKPLGSGILLAAHMRALCRASWMESLLDTMLTNNSIAASMAIKQGVSAMTDITGFGLAGHLLELLSFGPFSAELWLDEMPVLPGAASLWADGVESTLAPSNRAAEDHVEIDSNRRQHPAWPLLFDPQTNGGLLIAAPAEVAHDLAQQLRSHGHAMASVVGEVTPVSNGMPRIRVR